MHEKEKKVEEEDKAVESITTCTEQASTAGESTWASALVAETSTDTQAEQAIEGASKLPKLFIPNYLLQMITRHLMWRKCSG